MSQIACPAVHDNSSRGRAVRATGRFLPAVEPDSDERRKRMRRRLAVLLLAPVFLVLVPTTAAAAPPSSDPVTAAKIAATWLAHQVNEQGFIPQSGDPNAANLSNSAQAVLALAAAGVGRTQVDALL